VNAAQAAIEIRRLIVRFSRKSACMQAAQATALSGPLLHGNAIVVVAMSDVNRVS
jgi:hypothetical protein